MTTDADGQVDPEWASATLAAMSKGADAVAGWAELDPIDWGSIPQGLHEADARECAYDALCDEIHARLDPDPRDPWPRHTQASGASIALTAEAYVRCGGVPDVGCGEDRALIAALRAVDARVRHAPEVHVMVSGRTIGRALGGMAETIRRRLIEPDAYLNERLEPAWDCARRASAKAASRRLFDGQAAGLADLATHLMVSQAALRSMLHTDFFGQAWRAIEATSPPLA